jgi:tetraacyldisaccharide 4'-kinase
MSEKRLIRNITDALLAPAGWAVHAAARFRAEYYAAPSRQIRLPAPCISVGNLTWGGTGKTPFTVFLVRECLGLGYRPAVLLRGYGRKSAGPRAVTSQSTWQEVGDEALLLARNLPGVPILVGERREEAAALAPDGTDLFILDDGFQHLRVHRDLDAVLVDASRPDDLAAPPRGRLREPVDAIRRAHLLVLTHGNAGDMSFELALRWAGKPRVGVRFEWEERSLPHGVPWTDLKDRPCAVFSGIGHPEAFFEQARRAGFRVVSETPFPDHAAPTPARLSEVLAAARAGGAEWVLCTEKDMVKWGSLWNPGNPPLHCPRLTVVLDDPAGCLPRLLSSLRA